MPPPARPAVKLPCSSRENDNGPRFEATTRGRDAAMFGHHNGVRVVVAPDKFRGTATARQLCDAVVAAGIADVEVIAIPVADGGEGTLEALGGANRTSTVTGPLGDPVEAPWRRDRDRAVIEMASASGLALTGGPLGNDAIAASTYGTGELIALAVESGCNEVVVGVGGSATTDGGLGAIGALEPLGRYRGVHLIVACDVAIGFLDAAEVFARQKGASDAEVELLSRRLHRLAQVYEDRYGVDVRGLRGAGAAGGLAGGLAAIGARLVDGFDLVADETGLFEAVEGADLVITGEGFLDEQSFAGKAVGGVAGISAECGVPVVAVVGDALSGIDVPHGIEVVSLTERFGAQSALSDTVMLFAAVAAESIMARCPP